MEFKPIEAVYSAELTGRPVLDFISERMAGWGLRERTTRKFHPLRSTLVAAICGDAFTPEAQVIFLRQYDAPDIFDEYALILDFMHHDYAYGCMTPTQRGVRVAMVTQDGVVQDVVMASGEVVGLLLVSDMHDRVKGPGVGTDDTPMWMETMLGRGPTSTILSYAPTYDRRFRGGFRTY